MLKFNTPPNTPTPPPSPFMTAPTPPTPTTTPQQPSTPPPSMNQRNPPAILHHPFASTSTTIFQAHIKAPNQPSNPHRAPELPTSSRINQQLVNSNNPTATNPLPANQPDQRERLQQEPPQNLPNPIPQLTNREIRRTNLPNNSCAFIAVFEALRGADELSQLHVNFQDQPVLVSLLRRLEFRGCNTTFANGIQRLMNFSRTTQQPLQQPQDAWLVLMNLRRCLSQYSKTQFVPIVRSCNNDSHATLGDLESMRSIDNKFKYELTYPLCAHCGHGEGVRVELPPSFYIRLLGEPRRGVLDHIDLPKFSNYRKTIYIQFNPVSKHYRTIRYRPGKLTIYDNGSEVTTDCQDMETIIHDNNWKIYIVGYSYINSSDIPPNPNWKNEQWSANKVWSTTTRKFIGGTNDPDDSHAQGNNGNNQSSNQDNRNNTNNVPTQEEQLDLAALIALNDEPSPTLQPPPEPPVLSSSNDVVIPDPTPAPQRNPAAKTTIPPMIERFRERIRQQHHQQEMSSHRISMMVLTMQSFIEELFEQQQRQIASLRSRINDLELRTSMPPPIPAITNATATSQIPSSMTPNKPSPVKGNSIWGTKKEPEPPTNPISPSQPPLHKPNEQIRPVPPKACGYISVFDLIEGTDWMNSFKITKGELKSLINVLTVKKGDAYIDAIRELRALNINKQLPAVGQPADPWQILCQLQQTMETLSQPRPRSQLYPTFGCACGTTVLQGNPDYTTHRNQWRLRNTNCSTCDNTIFYYKPAEFFARLIKDKSAGTLSTFGLPYIPNYSPTAVIQYCQATKHFRCLKMFGKQKTILMDGHISTTLMTKEKREEHLRDSQWQNYIVHFRRFSNAPEDAKPKLNALVLTTQMYGQGFLGNSNRSHIPNVAPGTSRLTCWNVNSMNLKEPEKLGFIRAINAAVTFIVEPRKAINIHSHKCYNSLHAEGKHKKLNCSIIVDPAIDITQRKSEIDYVSVIARGQPFSSPTLLVCTYHNNTQRTGNSDKAEASRLLYEDICEFSMEFTNRAPDIVVAGDFNCTYEEMREKANRGDPLFQLLTSFQRSEYNHTCTKDNSYRQIDFIFSTINLNSRRDSYFRPTGLSDHLPLVCQIETQTIIEPKIIPNKQFSHKVYEELMKLSHPTIEDLKPIMDKLQLTIPRQRSLNTYERYEKPENREQLELIEKNLFTQDYLEKLNKELDEVAQLRFTKFHCSYAFQKLKRITHYHEYSKRDGGFMVRAKMGDRIITGEALNRQIIEHYRTVHNNVPNTQPQQTIPIIPTSDEQIKQMARNVKTSRAISHDSFPDKIFELGKDKNCKKGLPCTACSKKINFLRSLLNPNYWRTPESKEHLVGRLVCLNKKYPKLPNIPDYRPIVVLSPVYKFLQGYLMSTLRLYAKNSLSKDQFGFVPGISIEECKESVLRQLDRRNNRKLSTSILFLDLNSAYDRVDRRALIAELKRKNILSQDQIHLLQFLFTQSSTQLGRFRIHTTNGVPQGGTSSPVLFDIFIDPLIDRFNAKRYFNKQFADDILILGSLQEIKDSINVTEQWARNNNMIINKSKSGIMPYRHSFQSNFAEYNGYPIVTAYKYLGLYINDQGTIDTHMKEMAKKWNFVKWRLTGLRKRNKLKLNINLFRVLIMPLYRLSATTFHRLNDTSKRKAEVQIKVQFKVFCNLPINMSDENFGLLFGGTVAQTLDRFNRKTVTKLYNHQARNTNLDAQALANEAGITTFKKFPDNLVRLLNTIYKSRCGGNDINTSIKCGGQITRTTHLRESHNYNIDIRLILRAYNEKYEGIARIMTSKGIKFVETIRIPPGRPSRRSRI